MIDYLKYLSEDERQQYEEARAAIIESTDKEEQAQGLLSDLFINHFRNVSYNPLEELQAAAREDIQSYKWADYENLFIRNKDTGEIFFKSNIKWFLLFIDNKAIFDSVTSQTKQGFIDFLTVVSDRAPEVAYNSWIEDHNEKAALFNTPQIITEWANFQYQIIKQQRDNRQKRALSRKQAEEEHAIMTINKNRFPIPSNKDLWEAFAPGRICKIGDLKPDYIDSNTGELIRLYVDENGKRKEVFEKVNDVDIRPYVILSAIVANSVDNLQNTFIENGNFTFYVKGVVDSITKDARGFLADNEVIKDFVIDRKSANVIYLERLFKPLTNLVGLLPNGSRYSVFNYIGYNAENDTMTISTPYIYQLWHITQAEFINRQAALTKEKENNKKPSKENLKPFEANKLIKGPALLESSSTLEVVKYITNLMLAAGRQKEILEMNISFKTIIDNCPSMKQRINNINTDDKKKNKAAFVNRELQKIGKAIDIIQDPEKCGVKEEFNILDISPSKEKANKTDKFILIPPTKSQLDRFLSIKWEVKNK